MIQEISKEIAEHIIFYFIVFCVLCLCYVSNKEAMHNQAIYESQFYCRNNYEDGFALAMINPSQKNKHRAIK